jgi:ankyrin repeat protein
MLIELRFQWVILEIEIFLSQIHDTKIFLQQTIDTKIETLKTSKLEPIEQLDKAYDDIYAASIGRNNGQNEPGRRVVVDNALQWLLCSYRDLTIDELLIAVSIQRDGTKHLKVKKSRLRNLLSNFVTEGPSGEVRLAHLTIRPYLEKQTVDGQSIFEFSNINLTAALTCLHVMRFSSMEENHLQHEHRAEMEDSDAVDVKCFKAYSSFYWSLHSRAASNSKEVPKELQDLLKHIYGSVQQGPSDESTWTPFHDAIEQGQNEAVEYLIASNASLDQQDKLGNTPLHEAVQYRNAQALQVLLRCGAASQIKNNNGNTPLHLAAFTSAYGLVHQLLREEALPNEINFSGQAPIHVAVLHGRTEAVRAFISSGVDIDLKDYLQNSPLHYAVFTNQQNIALMLIRGGCAVNSQNEDGNSPLHFATRIASNPLSTLLLRNAARVDIRNKEGQTPTDPRFLIGLPSKVTGSLLEALATEKTTPRILPEYSFEVETLGFCSKCDNFAFWANTAAQSMYHEHHCSFRALQQSAGQGCRLCDLILKSILADVGTTPTDQPATNISVKFLFSRNRGDGNSQDLLIVRMGREVVTSLELFVDKGMYSQQLSNQ